MRPRPVLRAALATALAAAAGGCVAPPCPAGSHDEMGRCLTDVDAAIDAPGLDVGAPDAAGLDAPGLDAPGLDTFALPDGCVAEDLFEDRDLDGHGDATRPTRACPGAGVARTSDDCDDGAATTHPGASELCNGEDDDCDTSVDESIQRLLGRPRTVEGTDPTIGLAVTAVGDAYVVAWFGYTRTGFLGRLTADGTLVSTSIGFGASMGDGVLRLVPIGDDRVAVVHSNESTSPARVLIDVYRTTDEPMTLLGSVLDAESSIPTATSVSVSATRISAIYVNAATQLHGVSALLSDLAPLAPVPLPYGPSASRSLHQGPDGPVLLEARGSELVVTSVDPVTWEERATGSVTESDTTPSYATVDPAGRATVLAGSATVHFAVGALSGGTIASVRTPITLHMGLPNPPHVGSSMAGADLVWPAWFGSDTGLEWQHIEPGGSVTWGHVVGDGESTFGLAGARLSTRRGAVFHLGGGASPPRVTMQDIGCE